MRGLNKILLLDIRIVFEQGFFRNSWSVWKRDGVRFEGRCMNCIDIYWVKTRVLSLIRCTKPKYYSTVQYKLQWGFLIIYYFSLPFAILGFTAYRHTLRQIGIDALQRTAMHERAWILSLPKEFWTQRQGSTWEKREHTKELNHHQHFISERRGHFSNTWYGAPNTERSSVDSRKYFPALFHESIFPFLPSRQLRRSSLL